MSKLKILFVLYPGVTHLDFTGPHQVLSRAPNSETVVASLGGQDIEAEGLTFTNLADLAKVDRCDVICVPGGFGTTAAMLDEAFMAEVRRLGAGATYVTSVCTGSLILGAAGFLKGKRAACHWAWRALLEPFGAIVGEERVVRDGNIITGGGVTAGIDFGFVMLEELAGRDYAEGVQLGLEYAPDPPFHSGRPERMSTAVDGRAEAAAQAARRAEPA
jgi:cyclohexyl-isocyanide hydratase